MQRITTYHYDGFIIVIWECDCCKLDKPALLIATVMVFPRYISKYLCTFLYLTPKNTLISISVTPKPVNKLKFCSHLAALTVHLCLFSVWLLLSNFLLHDSSSFISSFYSVFLASDLFFYSLPLPCDPLLHLSPRQPSSFPSAPRG